MSKTKNQHFVPRFYLKYFADSKRRIWVFDKINRIIFNPSIENIASKNFFYDNIELDSKYNEAQYLEKLYSKIESEFAPKYNDFINRVLSFENYIITEKDKEAFSKYLISQIDRTNEHREEATQLYKHHRKLLIETGCSLDLLKQMGFEAEEMDSQTLHLESIIAGIDNIDMYAEMLCDHIWIVLKNDTTQPFYTSDNPIVKQIHIENEDGFASPGIEIAFPLTPNHMLVLFEREYFQSFETIENNVLSTTDIEFIGHYNTLQVNSSNRQIYSSLNNFELIEVLSKINPNSFDPNRLRV